MGQVTINGKTYKGNNISMINNRIIIDGKEIDETQGNKNITINVNIIGNCGPINCNGSVTINSNVTGDVDAGGSISVKNK